MHGWMDRTYDSIPKAYRMTRAHWLAMKMAADERAWNKAHPTEPKLDSPAEVLSGRALAQVDAEDFAAAKPFGLQACAN